MNNISVDERDIFSYIDLEQYIIERNYLLSYREYELIKVYSYLLNRISIVLEKENDEIMKVQMFFETSEHSFFNCWTKVDLKAQETLRRRNMKLNEEDVQNYEDFVSYAKERNYVLNGEEFYYLTKDKEKTGLIYCKFEPKNNDSYFYNQVTGKCYMIFKGDKNLTIYLKSYMEDQLERRKEEKICTLKRITKV